MNTFFRIYLRRFILVFFDDILEYFRSAKDHRIHLDEMLSVLKKRKFFIKASKCAFMLAELEYLRYFLPRDGIKVDQRKIEAITYWSLL